MNCLKNKKAGYKNCLLIAATTIVVMLICCAYTSPLYPYYYNGDNAIFLLLGKGITEGKTCYVDLFDHKGPILFFIEALGLTIGGRTGVWCIECLGALLSVAMIVKTCKELESKWIVPVLATAIVYLYLFGHGNLSENFSLPMIYVCLYFAAKYYKSEEVKHPPIYALIYGIAFGLLAFIRINNALIICAVVLCIIIRLIKNKQFGNLLLNLTAGAAGAVLVAAPICLYFYSKDALYDMFYCTFLYNLLYAGTSTHVSMFSSLKVFALYAALYAPVVFSTVVFALRLKKAPSAYHVAMLVAASLSLIMLAYSNIYDHYFTLAVPVFTLAVAAAVPNVNLNNAISELKKKSDGKHNYLLWAVLLVSVVYLPLSAYRTAAPIYKTYLTDIEYDRYSQVSSGASVIPEEERDSVIGYSIPPEWYIDSEILPCYKYYTMQKWWTTPHLDVYGEFLEFLETEHPLWIITRVNVDDQTVMQVLEDDYELVTENDYACYYRYCGDKI